MIVGNNKVIGNENTGDMISIMGNVRCFLRSINYGFNSAKELFDTIKSDLEKREYNFNQNLNSKISYNLKDFNISVSNITDAKNIGNFLYEIIYNILVSNKDIILKCMEKVYTVDSLNIYKYLTECGGYISICHVFVYNTSTQYALFYL